MKQFSHITGLIAAPHTPLDSEGEVDEAGLDLQIEALAAQGLAGVFVNGTTGEGLSLTSAERRSIVEKWCGQAPADLKVIVHVGHHSVSEASALSRHAAEAGAYGVATTAPSFVKPETIGDLVDFCAPIAAAAPELPFYYYHFPGLTGVNLPMRKFLEEGGGRIPNLAGIKYTHMDLFGYQQCRIVDGGRFDILWGVDEALLGALAVGAVGAVGSTYNYASAIYLKMMEAFAAGDMQEARRCSQASVALVEILLEYGVLASGKALMSLHGIDCGPPRPPVAALTTAGRAEMLARVEALGVICIIRQKELDLN